MKGDLTKIVIFPIIFLLLLLFFFVPPEDDIVIWSFIFLISLFVVVFLSILLRGRGPWYVGLFLGYFLYLLWKQVVDWELILYGLLVVVLLEFLFRIRG